MTLRAVTALVRKASRTTAPMRDWGPLPVESLQGSRTHRTVGWLAAAGAVVPIQGYRCPDSTKAAKNHPPCATATAGVGKQTIYRWWPSKGAVVFEALLEDLRVSLTFDDTGDLRADLTTQVTSLSRVFASPDGRHMAALIGGAQGDPDLAQALLEHWVRPRRRYAMAFLQQAKDRGQLRPDLDLEVGIDIIWAPLYYRLLLHYAPLDEAHAAAVP